MISIVYTIKHKVISSTETIDSFCASNPTAVKVSDANCAQFYNCSATTAFGHHLAECPYPELFSVSMATCAIFTSVACGNRSEPQAPCKMFHSYGTIKILIDLIVCVFLSEFKKMKGKYKIKML